MTKNEYRKPDDVDTFEQWNQGNKAILGNNADPQNVFMFMNACANKPLYQGGMEKVSPYMTNVYDSAPVSSGRGIPFPRMGYDLDVNQPVPPSPQLSNNNLRLGEDSQQMMFGQNNMNAQLTQLQLGEAKLNAQRSGVPLGMRLPMMATKGKMGASPSQLFDSDNDSVYDSDGEYESM